VLDLDINPSRSLRAYLRVLHGLAAVAVLLLPLVAWLQGLLVLLLALLYRHSCRRYLRHYRLLWRDSGWRVCGAAADYGAELLDSSLLNTRLTLLNFRLDNGDSLSIPVTADALGEDDFRRLRVHLRVNANKPAAHARMKS
jgi:hypothetical protein